MKILFIYLFNLLWLFTADKPEAPLVTHEQEATVVVADSVTREMITDSVINFSKKFIGTPYRYGAMNPGSGFDCSHFVSYVHGNAGVTLPTSSTALATQGEEIKFEDIRKGDLMFFKGRSLSSPRVGHVSLVIDVKPGSIKMIHATHRGVIIDEYYNMKYYQQRYLQARRISY